MHRKRIAGDYFVSYATRNISAKRDKIYVERIIDAVSSASGFINFEQKKRLK
jgi:hypothetical protein